VWRGTLEGAVRHLAESEPRGEYVLVLDGAPGPPAPDEADVEAALRTLLAAGSDKRTAIARVAAELDVPKRRVYDVALRVVDG
jgi:16S rRNA (cytidine1402-2'-O)-methyltransferase